MKTQAVKGKVEVEVELLNPNPIHTLLAQASYSLSPSHSLAIIASYFFTSSSIRNNTGTQRPAPIARYKLHT